jgi:glycerol uptake facilitator protein
VTPEKFVAEVFGTAILVLLGDGVVAGVLLAKSKAHGAPHIEITIAWAFAVFCGVVVAGPISGAQLNPAVTLGLAITGAISWADVPGYWAAQMVGAFIGAALVAMHYWDHFKATDEPAVKLGVFSTSPAIPNLPLNFMSELLGTFVLVFVILAFGHNGSSAGLAALGALPVSLLVLVIGCSLGGTTGYAINPARDLGPRIAHFLIPIPGKGDSDWSYSWIPVAGPLAGAAVAAVTYQVFFANFADKVIPH